MSKASFEVKSSSELGRHLVALRDLEPGDVILEEGPLVFGPKALQGPENMMPCVGCYRAINVESGERCHKCGWPVCSGICPGLKDPRHHGAECVILSLRPECALNNMQDYYRHDTLLPLRCLLLQQTNPEKWKKMINLQSNMEIRKPGTEPYEEADEYTVRYLHDNFLKHVKTLESIQGKTLIPELSKGLLHKICGIIDTNALEIRLFGGTELSALYENTCLMEHNCVPNTKHTFNVCASDPENEFKITVKVVVPLKTGDHISTMYSHALWGTMARRQHLRDTKYFMCKCQRCSDPTELGTYLSAMKCIGDGVHPCDGIHLPEDPLDEESEWACNKCIVKVSGIQVSQILAQMGEEVENVQMSNPSVKDLENIINKLSLFLHPNHYHLYELKHSLVQRYGHQHGYLAGQLTDQMINKKIEICRELLKVTKVLDPGNARLSLYTGVLQHELHLALVLKIKKSEADGKINQETEAIPELNKAKEALTIAIKALQDDLEESSGRRLYGVIKDAQKDFEKYCKHFKLDI